MPRRGRRTAPEKEKAEKGEKPKAKAKVKGKAKATAASKTGEEDEFAAFTMEEEEVEEGDVLAVTPKQRHRFLQSLSKLPSHIQEEWKRINELGSALFVMP